MKVTSEARLRKLYGFPSGREAKKSLLSLDPHAKNFIGKSPFLVMATVSQTGKMDNSPRGGKPGFVQVLDDNHILIPDSKGNNRLDSLVNIVENGRVGLFFMLPGIDETLRINGSAEIRTDIELLDRFADEQNPPKTCLVIEVEEMFLHCANWWVVLGFLFRLGMCGFCRKRTNQTKTRGHRWLAWQTPKTQCNVACAVNTWVG